MLHKRHDSVVTLFVLLSIVGVSKPATAFILAQSDTVSRELSVAEKSPQDTAAIRSGLKTTEDVIAKAEISYKSGLYTSNSEAAQGKLADADHLNPEVEGSGEINSELEDSGSVNPEVEGSGEINSELENSGSVNPEVDGSGEINSELEDSGSVNPQVEDSGEPLVLEKWKTQKLADLEFAIAQNNEAIPSNDVLEPETAESENTATESRWWLWLIPLLGVFLLAAIFIFGGKKKSDQEPAIGNMAQPDAPGGGSNTLGTIDGNRANNLGNVAKNTAIPTVGAAVVGGAAANILERKNRTVNETDLNLDLDARESDLASEIPVNPVSEFSDQERQLQFGEQSTKLQSDIDNDLNLDLAQLSNDSDENNNTFANGTVLDEVASTPDSSQDSSTLSDDFTLDSITDNERIAASELDQDSDESTATNIGREFRGDFVLDEETRNTLPSADNVSRNEYSTETTNETSTVVSDSIDESISILELSNLDLEPDPNSETVDNAVQIEDATADLVEPQQDVSPSIDESLTSTTNTNVDVDVAEDDSSIDLDGSETTESTSATVSELREEFTTPGLELNNLDLEPDPNSETVDSAAQVEAATADLVEPQQDVSPSIDESLTSTTNTAVDVDVAEDDSSIDLDGSETTESTSVTVSELRGEFTTPGLELNNLDLEPDPNSETVDSAVQVEAATADLVEPQQDVSPSIDESLTSITNTNVDVDVAEDDSSIDLDGSETTESTSVTVSELRGEFTTPALELNNLDLEQDPNSETVDSATSSFVKSEQDAEFSFSDDLDDDLDLYAASEVDSAEMDFSLEEMTLDEGDSLSDLSLDEIIFDDTDSSINASFEEITFEDAETSSIEDLQLSTDTQDISLDSLSLDETESELLSNSNAEITSLSDDQSNDLNNISQWLDSLDTPNQSTEDITEWLDSLDTNDNESTQEEQDQDMTMDLEAEADDISFKFLEDLLDRDSNS